MTVAKNSSVKKPQDHKPKAPPLFTVAEVGIDGERYPANAKLTFAQNAACEDATGKGFIELSSMTQFGVLAWLAMRAVIPSMTWEAFSESTPIEDVELYDKDGHSATEFSNMMKETATEILDALSPGGVLNPKA